MNDAPHDDDDDTYACMPWGERILWCVTFIAYIAALLMVLDAI